jgi:hypothetical protein
MRLGASDDLFDEVLAGANANDLAGCWWKHELGRRFGFAPGCDHQTHDRSIATQGVATAFCASLELDPVQLERRFELAEVSDGNVSLLALKAANRLVADPGLSRQPGAIPPEKLTSGDAVLRLQVPHRADYRQNLL